MQQNNKGRRKMNDLTVIACVRCMKENNLIYKFSDECGEVDFSKISDFIYQDITNEKLNPFECPNNSELYSEIEDFVINYLRNNGYSLQ